MDRKLDRKTIGIGLLSLTGLALLLACFIDKPAQAEFAVKDRDYQLVTVRLQNGDDALYVIDNRAGKVVVFVYDANLRKIVPAAGKNMWEAFSK